MYLVNNLLMDNLETALWNYRKCYKDDVFDRLKDVFDAAKNLFDGSEVYDSNEADSE